MAIDSAEKRKAVAGIPFWPLSPSVTPNSGKDAEWRQEAAHGYPWVAVAATEYTGNVLELHAPTAQTISLTGKI